MDAEARGFGNLDIDGDRQSGSARMLFWGITLERLRISEHCDRPFRLIVTGHFANA